MKLRINYARIQFPDKNSNKTVSWDRWGGVRQWGNDFSFCCLFLIMEKAKKKQFQLETQRQKVTTFVLVH